MKGREQMKAKELAAYIVHEVSSSLQIKTSPNKT